MIKKLKDIIFMFLLLFFASSFVLQPVLTGRAYAAPCRPTSQILGLPTWYKYLPGEEVGGKCNPQLNIEADDNSDGRRFNAALPIGLAILEIFIRLAGLVAVVMVILGAFRFITSQGNADNATAARKTVINALIGLVVVILATTVVNFIGNSLT